MLPSPVGWGLFLEAPFQSWAAAAGWEEAGAACCSEGLPGLPGGPGQDQGGYSWLVPKTRLQRGFQWMSPCRSIVGCRLPAQVIITLWMGSIGLFAAMNSLGGGWDSGSARSAEDCSVPGVCQVMEELNLRRPWLLKQGLEGLAGLKIVIQTHGTGGTLISKENPGKRCYMLQCPLQWRHGQEVFPG